MINENDRTIFLDTDSRFNINQMNFSTMNPEMISSDVTYESQATNDLDLTTLSMETKVIIEEQWFNVNQSNRRDPYRSALFWNRTDGKKILNFLYDYL